MLCHVGRTWLVYYGCFWSQHVQTVHVFSLMFQLFPLISPQAIHWCYPTTKSPQSNPLMFSEFSLISLQKCNNVSLVHTNLFTKIWTCIFMNIAKILNEKLFQSFHNVKGKQILSCDVPNALECSQQCWMDTKFHWYLIWIWNL